MRYTSAKHRPSSTFDANLQFKDAGLVAADAAAQVGGSNKIVDLGTGHFVGSMTVDVSAIETASSDERYDIIVQLSNSATFSSGIVDAACLILAHATPAPGDTTAATGRYTLLFHNEWNGTWYRYARVFTDVTGTVATGINYTAYASPIN